VTSSLIPISRLLAEGRPAGSSVCVDSGRVIDWDTFEARVAGLCSVLALHGPGRWVIFTENTCACAAAMLAAWQCESVAVLAPNGQPGTLAELSEGAHGLVGDHGVPGVLHVPHEVDRQPRVRRWRHVDRDAVRVELVTSGSTGTAKTVPKTLRNLEDEIAELERRWGTVVGDTEVFGTVSHQHIYGLLFRVLWPLSVGRPFRAQTYLSPEELAARMAEAGRGALVASPAHLSRLKESHGLRELVAHCGTIFSSGGPLDRPTALALASAVGAAPIEVFGSTETGGVAWRRQDGTADSLAWTLFDSVTADPGTVEGRLHIRSPFVSGATEEYTMADRVQFLADGRFVLGTRDDRTVKVGDKRLSLPDMEAALAGHEYVAQAALVVLDHERGARLGAAIVPTASGRAALIHQGRRAVSQILLQALEPYWDRILVPRAWRYVDRLPEDAQGKVTVSGLRAVFATQFDPAVVSPEVISESTAERTRQQTLRVPETLGCLDGHFDALAVVPGVAQLRWVMDVAREMTGAEVALERLEALKFKDLLRPGDLFHLSVELSAGNDRLSFRLWNERGVFSSGRCLLASPGPPP
jgi:AMP-binding enzyme